MIWAGPSDSALAQQDRGQAAPNLVVPQNITPEGQNTWESKFKPDERAKFSNLFRTYMCLSADPPPECLKRRGDIPTDAATMEDIEALKLEALENAAWGKIRDAWPDIKFDEDEVAIITRRARERDDPEALEMLGYMLNRGEGIAVDKIDAFKTYRRAYEKGRRGAGPALAEIFRDLNPAQKKELNVWLKAQENDGAGNRGRALGPPSPLKPAT